MPRRRFLPGLFVGLLIGVPLGAAVTAVLLPPGAGGSAVTPLELQDLRRRLETVQEDRDSLRRQVDEFAGLAERMGASFRDLERRFKVLERAQQAGGPPGPTPP